MEGIINNKDLQKKLENQIHDMMLGKLQDIDGVDSVDWLPLARIFHESLLMSVKA